MIKIGKMIYQYNQKYFEFINTNEKAYWIGFIMADGYVFDNRIKENKSTSSGFRIRLSYIDKTHLEKMVKCMNGNIPVRIVKNYGTISKNCNDLAELQVLNKNITEDLFNIGFSNGNKSLKEFIPNVILNNESLTKSFILGLWDGDGYIACLKNNRYEWGLLSSEEVINFIKNFLEEKLNIKFNKIDSDHRNQSLIRLRISRRASIKKIRDYLYSDNQIFLDRKYEIIKNLT